MKVVLIISRLFSVFVVGICALPLSVTGSRRHLDPATHPACPALWSPHPCGAPDSEVEETDLPKIPSRRHGKEEAIIRTGVMLDAMESQATDILDTLEREKFQLESMTRLMRSLHPAGVHIFLPGTAPEAVNYATKEGYLWQIYTTTQAYGALLWDAEWQEYTAIHRGHHDTRRIQHSYQTKYRRIQYTACSLICYIHTHAHQLLGNPDVQLPVSEGGEFSPAAKDKTMADIDGYILLSSLVDDYIRFARHYLDILETL